MRSRILGLGLAAGLGVLCAATPVTAAPCYIILDRNDTVIFRDTTPPFDLSAAGSSERALMRQRGQHLLVAEFEKCNAVGFISPTTGGTTATVDEIVMQLQPAIATTVGSPRGSATSAASGSGVSTPATPARAAPKSGY